MFKNFTDDVFENWVEGSYRWLIDLSERYAKITGEPVAAEAISEFNDFDLGIEMEGTYNPGGFGPPESETVRYTIPWWIIHRARKGRDWEDELEERLKREKEEKERERLASEQKAIRRVREQRYQEYLEYMEEFEPERYKEIMSTEHDLEN